MIWSVLTCMDIPTSAHPDQMHTFLVLCECQCKICKCVVGIHFWYPLVHLDTL